MVLGLFGRSVSRSGMKTLLLLLRVKIAKYEETEAELKSLHDSLQTEYHSCHSQVRIYRCFLCGIRWRFSVAVTRWSRSMQLLYIEPG